MINRFCINYLWHRSGYKIQSVTSDDDFITDCRCPGHSYDLPMHVAFLCCHAAPAAAASDEAGVRWVAPGRQAASRHRHGEGVEGATRAPPQQTLQRRRGGDGAVRAPHVGGLDAAHQDGLQVSAGSWQIAVDYSRVDTGKFKLNPVKGIRLYQFHHKCIIIISPR